MFCDVLIIGAGASGLAAATSFYGNKLKITIVDSNERIGKKLISTGNGRCNISNSLLPNINKHNLFYFGDMEFIKTFLESFNLNHLHDYFDSIGLPLIELESNKIYPLSLQASSVIDIFLMEIKNKNIETLLGYKVFDINKQNNFFMVSMKSHNEVKILKCKYLIVAGGGMAVPSSGSDGSCYKFAKKFGHGIEKPLPSLVQLKLDFGKLKALSGVKFKGNASIFVNDEFKRREFGEILFTDYGISGPPILQISRYASVALYENKLTFVEIDLFPEYSLEELGCFFTDRFLKFQNRTICESLIGVMNKKLIPIVLKECGILEIHDMVTKLETNKILKIVNLLKSWRFKIIDTTSFTNSQVTAGGVSTKDINPETMESKLVENLYFTGEILDIDGDCGGLNLHFAFGTGNIAAKNISKKVSQS